jgi:hypothetical protein
MFSPTTRIWRVTWMPWRATIRLPDIRLGDTGAGRERLYRKGVGPLAWMRVVIEFEGPIDVVVTAFGQTELPPR